ncbi:PH (Pleckstrin Homology) domain-containing protein [Chitinophaga niastensis]|uniref:PH (Pleckstrin Homology) domain-containing protein n=1 Tax=Chitinophaga niastensis TaxID=536980 RepID=A0A2P8H9J7_CHINA|nr:PH domain-containing protein [Chitinophaga niastensis]PSL42871.1 PH (Pleckstrin Homology) domain-containing protein [Chitinophaga niastensis]
MRYAAKYDFLTKIITHGVIILTLILFAIAFNTFPKGLPVTIGPVALIIAIFLSWGYSPLYYEIKEDAIVIKRPLKNLSLPLKDIRNISMINQVDLGGSIRLFGSGGLFGYNGTFMSNKIGRYQMWCTNRETLILIEYKDKKILISPSEDFAFLNDATERMKHYK